MMTTMTTCGQCASAPNTTCAFCQSSLCAEHAVAGQQFITARQLIVLMITTLVRAPRMLGEMLFKELDQVDYCTTCRQQLAVRRNAEQLKFLGGMVAMLVMFVGVAMAAAWIV